MRRVTQLSNLVELIENKTIIVETVSCEPSTSSDITEQDNIASMDFVESLQYLNEAKLFRDGIDFFYEFEEDKLLLKVGLKNLYMENMYIVECRIKEGGLVWEIDAKLRETIFDRKKRIYVVGGIIPLATT